MTWSLNFTWTTHTNILSIEPLNLFTSEMHHEFCRQAICILILGSQPKLRKERISAASNGESWAEFWNEAHVLDGSAKVIIVSHVYVLQNWVMLGPVN